MEHAKGADVAVHECFLPPTLLVTKQGFSPVEALTVGTQGHTSPEQFGKVMSEVKPRLAVGYHFYNDFDTQPEVYERVRKTYDGPLSLAMDYMVWNVTKEGVRTRMAVANPEAYPTPSLVEKKVEAGADRYQTPDSVIEGWPEEFDDLTNKIYSDFNKEQGTDFKFQLKK